MLGYTLLQKQFKQHIRYRARIEFSLDFDGEALAGIFVYHCQHAQLFAVVSSVLDKIIGPHVIAVL